MKKKRKPIKEESNDLFEGFFDWLDTEDGEAAWQTFDDVAAAFEGADLDINERKIIWADGKRLTIDSLMGSGQANYLILLEMISKIEAISLL